MHLAWDSPSAMAPTPTYLPPQVCASSSLASPGPSAESSHSAGSSLSQLNLHLWAPDPPPPSSVSICPLALSAQPPTMIPFPQNLFSYKSPSKFFRLAFEAWTSCLQPTSQAFVLQPTRPPSTNAASFPAPALLLSALMFEILTHMSKLGSKALFHSGFSASGPLSGPFLFSSSFTFLYIYITSVRSVHLEVEVSA